MRDILENETDEGLPPPSIVQFGGQTAINLAGPLHQAAAPIFGSSAEAIDLAGGPPSLRGIPERSRACRNRRAPV